MNVQTVIMDLQEDARFNEHEVTPAIDLPSNPANKTRQTPPHQHANGDRHGPARWNKHEVTPPIDLPSDQDSANAATGTHNR